MTPPLAHETSAQDTSVDDTSAYDTSAIVVEFADEQAAVAVDKTRMVEAVRDVLADANLPAARISLAIVDDATIHRINHDFLQHDYPTDVLSFALEKSDAWIAGQIVVSAETAIRNAEDYGQSVTDELLLYAIHGALHLVGYEDDSADSAAEMRKAESKFMENWK